MRKHHKAGKIPNTTFCGFECSGAEYARMKPRKEKEINCQHCLKKMGRIYYET